MKKLAIRKMLSQRLATAGILLLLIIFAGLLPAAGQSQPPVIFFTDIDSGPNSGGESVNGFSGAYVTLYGNFFGAPQGSSTVTWNGQNCLRVVPAIGSYSGWGTPHLWYQKIVVQVGPSCTPGAGNFVVTVNAMASNGIAFTVRSAGTLRFVSTTGNNSNSGSFASPFATIPHCKDAMKPGDICYIEDGVTAGVLDNFDSTLELESGGTAGNPIAFVAYPGATATLGSAQRTYGLRVPNINVSANYVTVAGLFFSPSDQGMNPTNSTNWRVVGNNFQCPTANGQDGCFTTNQISTIQFLGNEMSNTGITAASKQQHAVYFSTDTNHVVAAWNYIHDNRSCRAMQFHSSPLNGGGASDPTGHNMFDLSVHDNLIHDDPCDGINFATVDPSQGRVEAYNNVIYHTGIGPSPRDGDSGDYSCIYMAYITNTGPVGGGTVEIYNNTLYDCGAHATNIANNGSFIIAGGEASLLARIRNNVTYQLGSEPFGNGGGWNSSLVSGSNNVMHSTRSASLPSFVTGTITSDPLFLDLILPNLHLKSGSPAIDAAITINSSNTYNNYLPWNGNPMAFDGVSRPQGPAFDIGAFEFFTGSDSRPNAPTGVSLVAH
ncbi:MAG TPA: choice-of-anchor Q domain-containing protein [Candidatus Angelobacter sp.]